MEIKPRKYKTAITQKEADQWKQLHEEIGLGIMQISKMFNVSNGILYMLRKNGWNHDKYLQAMRKNPKNSPEKTPEKTPSSTPAKSNDNNWGVYNSLNLIYREIKYQTGVLEKIANELARPDNPPKKGWF